MTDDPYDDATDFDICPKCGNMAAYFSCEQCGGEGSVEYMDTPEVWGEDCPSYANHLVACPSCARGEGAAWWCKTCGQVVEVHND